MNDSIITVIIVTYNSEEYIQQCLSSIFEKKNKIKYEVIIVDNNSNDSTVSVIQNNFPEVILIPNNQNVGFAKANNQAIKIAKGKYLFLLNPDTEIYEDTIQKFHSFMEKVENKNVWCVGGQLFDEYGNYSKSLGKFPNLFDVLIEQFGIKGVFLKIVGENFFKKKYYIGKHHKEVEFIMGCDMFLRRSSLRTVGNFNESFFLNFEEVELSWRAKNKGYKNMVLPEVKILHHSGKSFSNLQSYLNHLWLGQILFFKLTRNKYYFFIIKAIHISGTIFRHIIKQDEIYINHMKKILSI